MDFLENSDLSTENFAHELFPMAYVRPILTDQGAGYGVFASDGTPLAQFGSYDAAFYAAKQHDLEPVSVH